MILYSLCIIYFIFDPSRHGNQHQERITYYDQPRSQFHCPAASRTQTPAAPIPSTRRPPSPSSKSPAAHIHHTLRGQREGDLFTYECLNIAHPPTSLPPPRLGGRLGLLGAPRQRHRACDARHVGGWLVRLRREGALGHPLGLLRLAHALGHLLL